MPAETAVNDFAIEDRWTTGADITQVSLTW